MTDGYELLLNSETVIRPSENPSQIHARRVKESLHYALRSIQIRQNFETSKLKAIILSKTARELGMNKSTLWYQKKRVLERGSVRLFRRTKQYFANA